MDDDDKYQQKALTTAILVDAGIELMRQNIRRSHPAMLEEQVDAMLSSWMCRMDEHIPGDTGGAVRVRERM